VDSKRKQENGIYNHFTQTPHKQHITEHISLQGRKNKETGETKIFWQSLQARGVKH
jgi:hypothetical protein